MKATFNNKKYFLTIKSIVEQDDFEQFKHFINCNDYPNIEKNDKDEIIFIAAYYSKNEEFINYLIFDYNISINEVIGGYLKLNSNIKKKFEMREIAKDLNINNELKQRKVKI